MKSKFLALPFVVLLICTVLLVACGPQAAKVRIGVYDSRSIAIAWAGTQAFTDSMAALQAEYSQAKAAGDTTRIQEIEAEAEGQQELLHKQAFSTAPVDDILATLEDQLPALQQEAGVSLLVSKWDEETLKKYPSAELIDVTVALVDALQPNERQRQIAIDVQNREPIPLEEAEQIQD